MKAFIRKEAVEIAWPVGVLFVAACVIWLASERFDRVLLAPNVDHCVAVAGTAVVAGALIAFLQFAAERWRGTLGFALQRADGHANLFAAKAIVGVVATLFLAIGPLVVFALWHRLFTENAAVMQVERLVEYAVYGVGGVSGYAMGAFASQLRRGWWLDLSVLVLGAAAVFFVTGATLMSLRLPMPASLLVYLLVQGVMTAGLLILAFKLMCSARDRGLLFPDSHVAALTAFFAVFLLMPADVLIGLLTDSIRRSIIEEYPVIAQDLATGKLSAVDAGSIDLADADFRADALGLVKQRPKARVVSRVYGDPDLDGSGARARTPLPGPAFPRPWQTMWYSRSLFDASRDRPFEMRGWFDQEDGVIRLFCLARNERMRSEPERAAHSPATLPMQSTLTKPNENGRFSASTTWVALDHDEWCVMDSEDGTLWRMTTTSVGEPLSELHLPASDRFVRFETVDPRRAGSSAKRDREPLFIDEHGNYVWTSSTSNRDRVHLFVGEHGKYVWKDGKFEPWKDETPAAAVSPSEAEAPPAVHVRRTDTDPITPAVEVRDESGENVLFSYQYTPESKATLALLYAAMLLRSPVICVWSFTSSQQRGLVHEAPVLADGRRPWLLALDLSVAALCAWSIATRWKRQGASRTAVVLAAAAVALFGVAAYVYFRGILPKHAVRPVVRPPSTEAHELLIQSA